MIYNSFGTLVNDDGTAVNIPFEGKIADIANETVSPSLVSGGSSKNFVTGVSGWIIRDDGTFELGSGSFRGIITVGVGSGSAGLTFNGTNGTIIVNDGTNDRILEGYLAGKF